MKIIIDTREQRPYSFTAWPEVETETGSLSTGDYSLAGLTDRAALERKSLDDLAGTLTSGRERFAAECQRGRGLDLFGLVIEGSLGDILNHQYKSRVNPQSLVQTLAAWSVRYGLTVWFAGNRQGGELMVYSILQKYLRDAQGRFDAIIKAHGTFSGDGPERPQMGDTPFNPRRGGALNGRATSAEFEGRPGAFP